jgi:catechol 2,3-dioxygenase
VTLPATTHPGRVRLQVADLGRSLAFYEGVLGLRQVHRSAHHAVLSAHDDDTPLVILEELPGAAPVRKRGHLGLFHFAILLPDRAALGRFLGHITSMNVEIGASDHLVSEAIYLHDPDGLGIEVYADRARESWERKDGQLVMGTLPLDAHAVMAAGAGAPWRGMPKGTVMGHMHLHVGDIEQAARFYRDGLGLEATVSSYPGALFLAAGDYHHHLGVNTWAGRDAPKPGPNDAKLLDWELILPSPEALEQAAARLSAADFVVQRSTGGWSTTDPWGTTLVASSRDRSPA